MRVEFLNFNTVQEWKIVSTPLAVSLLTKGAIYTFAMEVREPRLWTLNSAQFCFLCILSIWKPCRFDIINGTRYIIDFFSKYFFPLKGYPLHAQFETPICALLLNFFFRGFVVRCLFLTSTSRQVAQNLVPWSLHITLHFTSLLLDIFPASALLKMS